MKRMLGRMSKPVSVLICLLVVVGLCAALLLGTAGGRQALLDAVARAARSPELRLEMRGLELGATCSLERLDIADSAGTWLMAEGIRVRPDFGSLLRGRVSLDHLGVENLVLERLPQGGEATGPPTLPRLRLRGIDAPRIRLGQEVLGREALLAVRGELTLSGDESRAALEAARLDRPGDRLELDGLFSNREQTLDLSLDLHEEPEGLLHALLGAEGAGGITVGARGSGPVTAWPVAMSARISEAAVLAANATLSISEAPVFTLQATLEPGPGWTALTGLPGQPVSLSSRGAWEAPVLRVEGLHLESPAATVDADARWDTEKGELKGTANVRGQDLAPFLPAGLSPGQAEAETSITLDRSGLQALTDIRLQDWSVAGNPVPDAGGKVSLALPFPVGTWSVNATMDARLPSLPQGLREWTADTAMSGAWDAVNLERLTMDTALAHLEARGDLDSSLAINLNTRIRPAADIAPWAAFETDLQGRIDTRTPGLSGALSVNATDISGLPPEIAALAGREVVFRTGFTVTPDRLTLRGAEAAGLARLGLDGEWDFGSSSFQTTFQGSLPRARLNGLALPPGTRLDGRASGSVDSFQADLLASCETFAVAGIDVAGLQVRARANDLPPNLAGLLDAEARLNGEPAAMSLGAAWQDGRVGLTDCTLRLPGTEVAGDLELEPAAAVLTGTLTGRSSDLGGLGRVLGTDLGGNVELEAVFDASDGRQGVRLEADGAELRFSGAAVGRAEARASLTIPHVLQSADLDVRLQNVQWAGLSQDRVAARLRGSDDGMAAMEIDLEDAASDLDLRLRGRLATSFDRLVVDNLDGTLFALPLRMQAPLDLRLEAGGAQWPETVLTLGPARLQCRGGVAPDRIDIAAGLEGFDPALLRSRYPSLPQADVNADLTVRGTLSRPDASLRATAGGIRFENSELANLPAMDADMQCLVRDNALTAEASLSAGEKVSLAADFAASVNTAPGSPVLLANAALSGRVRGSTALSLITHVLRRDDQTLEGDCDVDYRIGGTWAEPSLTGQARVRDARYENFRSGTVVADIDAEARAQGSVITAEATGTDGNEGSVRAQGLLDLSDLSYSVDADLEGFRLLRTDLVRGVAAGSAQLRGSAATDMTLQGALTLDPSRVRLPSTISAQAPHIEVREINTNATEADPSERTAPFPLHLDLNVDIPARLTVQGRGLDSEWSGDFHLGGTQIEPAVSGEATLLRGKLDFLDRTFDLTKGSLVFSGETPPNPFLDIIGEVRVLDTMIQVNLTGPARSPRLNLSSVPALPQDELLSMILFGRSMREISPLQAVRLAQAAAEMTGIGGAGPGFLQSVKSKLGLQELEVSRDEDDNTAVGIGGYIGGKYYFRTRSSVSGQDKTTVEIHLTPDISVETEVGSDSRQGGGINWKHDY